MEYTRWLIEDIGFEGFRYDFVKGYAPWMVKGIAEHRSNRGGKRFRHSISANAEIRIEWSMHG
jgi:alpha-amylase